MKTGMFYKSISSLQRGHTGLNESHRERQRGWKEWRQGKAHESAPASITSWQMMHFASSSSDVTTRELASCPSLIACIVPETASVCRRTASRVAAAAAPIRLDSSSETTASPSPNARIWAATCWADRNTRCAAQSLRCGGVRSWHELT